MNEQPNDKNFSVPQPSDSEVVVLIKKLQQQLTFLEKKIDAFINQSQEKSSRPFSRPPHRGQYHDTRDQGEGYRERSFRPGRHFGKPRAEENQRFGPPRKNYRDERENSSGQDRNFKKRYDGEKRGLEPRKKPFFHGRKDRE